MTDVFPWYPIIDWVRHKLQKSEDELPANDKGMVLEIGAVIGALLSPVGYTFSDGSPLSAVCLGDTYADIVDAETTDAADKANFDRAVGLIVAGRLGFGVVGGSAQTSTAIKRKKTGTTEVEYADAQKSDGVAPVSVSAWEAEARSALLSIDCVQSSRPKPPAVVGVAGWARQHRQGCW